MKALDPAWTGRHQIDLDAIGDKHNVNIRFEDVARKFQHNISPRLMDFVEIASYVFAADCSTLRGEWTDAKREEPWGRDLAFVIAVREPKFWESPRVKSLIQDVLRFLSDDTYSFQFVPLDADRSQTPYFEFQDQNDWPFHKPDRVLMFSGGLDSLVSFFAVTIIPDAGRKDFLDNLIGGLAMHVVGPLQLRLVFHAFVVLVGVLILAGAVNTAIVGSNGVLNRVSEDGVLSAWFRQPHARFGTSYRIINLIAALQIVTIVLSRGDVFLLGEAYAFGVIWSFTLEALAVLVLRYRYPVQREYRVPLNLDWGRIHVPVGLGLITLSLLAIAIVNLFTKSIATVMGLTFTVIFFALFTASERLTRWRAPADVELDQFHLAGAEELTNQTVGVRPGNVLVMIHNYRRLDHLESVLERVRPEHHDIVALEIRVLEAGALGDRGIIPEHLFTANEQVLFTQALALAEKHGKTIHLALMASNQLWDGIVHAAQTLQSAIIVVGPSAAMSSPEEARLAGLAWERLPTPKRRAIFEVFVRPGRREVFFLGPHTPHLTPKEIERVAPPLASIQRRSWPRGAASSRRCAFCPCRNRA